MIDARLAPVLRHLRNLADPTGTGGPADAALLERLTLLRDQAAFEELVRRHGPLVRVCRRLLSDPACAEDAFQATLLLLWQRTASIRKPGSLASWLHGVAYRIARRIREDLRRDETAAPPPQDRIGTAPDPGQEAAWRELGSILEDELNRLPEKYRLALLATYWRGLTNEEAARELGWSSGTLKGRLARAREILHERLTARGVTLPVGAVVLLLSPGVEAATIPSALLANTARTAAALADGAASGLGGRASALAQEALPAAGLGKAKLAAVLALALGVAIFGAGVLSPPLSEEQPPVEAKQAAEGMGRAKKPVNRLGFDRHGDPLPPDALLRLGTLRHHYLQRSHGPPLRLADGKTALATNREEIRWVDLATGRLVVSWPLPTGQIVVGVAADGRLALLRDGQTLRLWDIASRKPLRSFQPEGGLNAPVCATFSPDSATAITVTCFTGIISSPLGQVRVWDVASGRELWREGHPDEQAGWYSLLGFLRGGKIVVLLDEQNNRVSLRDRDTGRQHRSFDMIHQSRLRDCRLSPDGTIVLTGTTSKGAVRIWDVATGKELPTLGGHKKYSVLFAVSPDSKIILTAGTHDPFVQVWDWPAARLRWKIDLLAGQSATALSISADGKRAEIVLRSEYVPRFYDLATGKELPAPTEAHRGLVTGVAFTPDGQLVSAGSDNTLRVWDVPSARQLHQSRMGHVSGATWFALSADGGLAATAFLLRGAIRLHEPKSGQLVRILDTGGEFHFVKAVTFAPRGKSLAASVVSGWRTEKERRFVVVWDAATGREVRRLEGASGQPVFSEDGRLLAVPDGGRVRAWEVTTGRERQGLPPGVFLGLAFSPDGRVLACRDERGVSLWDLAAAKERCRIEVASIDWQTLRFSPDGRWLAWQDMGIIYLADVLNGRIVHTFRGHHDWVADFSFAPDSRTLASGSYDTTVLIWDVAAVAARQHRPATRANAKAIVAAWDDLAGADAKAAYRAIRLLAEAPAQAVPLLGARLRPAPGRDAQKVTRLLTALDSAHFAERTQAVRELEQFRDWAESALRQFLSGGASLEARRRIEGLLARLEGPVTDRELLRLLRAVEALEWAGTAEARRVLEALAEGAPEARLTRTARAALKRLGKRPTVTVP